MQTHMILYTKIRIRKIDQDFASELAFKDIKFPAKSRNIHKVEKKNCISISIFGYENEENFSIYVSKNAFNRRVDLLL